MTHDPYGIPKRATFALLDENSQPVAKVWIMKYLVFCRNYTKNIWKRPFGKKKIVFYSDLKELLYSRSIPDGRNGREQELSALGLSEDATHWEIVKRLQGRTVSDEYSIRFL